MENEKEGMTVSINTKGCKTEFSHEFKDCENEAKNKSQSIISDEDKQNPKSTGSDRTFGEFKLSFSYNAIVISIMVYSGIIGIIGLVIAGVTLKISSPKSILIATFAMLFLIFVMISFVISARTVKPFVKIEFLKSLIENISGNNDLIKKILRHIGGVVNMKCLKILEAIKELCKSTENDKFSLILGIIQCIFASIACILAWFIPKRIMWEQNYSTLGNEYRTYDFAVAIQSIIEFFVITCKSDVEKIAYEYKKRFLKDMYGESFAGLVSLDDETILEKLRNEKSLKIGNCAVEKTLHYNKRILTQYFHELALCAKSPFIGKRRVQKDFTSSEAKIMKILFLMNKAVDDSDLLYKDISCDFRMPSPNRGKGMYKDLAYLYSILKRSNRFMDIK